MKNKKKKSVDIRLFILRNIMKTIKYYFKNIFYILFMNVVCFLILNKLFEQYYSGFILKFFSSHGAYKIAYSTIFIILFSAIKVILYGNTVYVMKSNGTNDIKDLFESVLKRFLPTIGTFIFYTVVCLFLTCLIVGPIFLFYYYFAIFLCAVGDVNNKDKNVPTVLNGAKALSRSYALVSGNLIRFSLLTIIMIFLTYYLNKYTISTIIELDFIFKSTTYNMISLCIFDLLIIYSSLMFVKLEGIENDLIQNDAGDIKDIALLNKAAINNFKTKKK